jgi:hypothetical protein
MEFNQCWFCGVHLVKGCDCDQLYTVDHVVPQIGPFVAACKKCNNLKSHSSIDDFKAWLGVDAFYGEVGGWLPW